MATELTSTRAPRVKAAVRLSKRAFRDRDCRFLAEGPQACREAAAVPGALLELYVTAEAAARYGALLAAARAGGAEVVPASRRGGGGPVRHRHPAGDGGRLRAAAYDRHRRARRGAPPRRGARPCARPGERGHGDPGGRRRWCRGRRAHGRERRPVQPQDGTGDGRLAVAPAGRDRRAAGQRGGAGARRGTAGARRRRRGGPRPGRPRRRRVPRRPPPRGSSATRPGGCRRPTGPWPTRSYASRSTAGPSR